MCHRHARWEGAWRDSHYGQHQHHHHGWERRWGQFQGRGAAGPPANVEETDDSYEIYLAAPGRSKEDFRLSIADEVLTISSERADTGGDNNRRLRNEFRIAPFERRFQLSSKVESDLITARYADGVLQVTLPKRPEFAGPVQEIAVA